MEQAKMKITLIPLDDYCPDEQIVLRDLPVMIGRSPEAQLRLEDRSVSRRHCEIGELEGKAVVRDLGSTNGTFVNGYSIRGEALLMPDDTLRVGATRFLVVYVPVTRAVPEASGVAALAGEDAA